MSYSFGYYSRGRVQDESGQNVLVEQLNRYRQISRDAHLSIAYPFSRVQRVELSAGARNISFDHEVQTDLISFDGQLLSSMKEDRPTPDPLNMAVASAALVYDNSFMGIASPILGQRYRIEAQPTFGSLNMVTGLVDFRKYIMPKRPFTLAARIMHYGRYGAGSEDTRIRDLFLGYPSMVRGYDYNSFSGIECIGAEDNTCPAFDQLFGSKMLLGNLELRFPPLGVLGLGEGYYGSLPLEAGIFADAGIAWSTDNPATTVNENAFFLGGDREPVFSTGFTVRFNLFGYFILGMDFVKPFQRPLKGWHMQFTMVPGF